MEPSDSPAMNFKGPPYMAGELSTRYSATSKTSSGPHGKGCSGARRYSGDTTVRFVASAMASQSSSRQSQ